MPILRIHFEESESNYEIASRVAGGLSPGDYLEVRGSVYVVSRGRNVNVTVRPTSKKIYQVVPCDPPTPVCDMGPKRGQVWVPLDKRRQHQVITLTDVFEDFVLTDKGRSISRTRLRRYRLLETLDSETTKRRQTLQKMRDKTPEEFREASIRAGIHTEDGQLAAPYSSKEPSTYRP